MDGTAVTATVNQTAYERLCKAPCRWFTTEQRSQLVYETYEDGRTFLVEYKQPVLPAPACQMRLRPIISDGGDCPYFEQARG